MARSSFASQTADRAFPPSCARVFSTVSSRWRARTVPPHVRDAASGWRLASLRCKLMAGGFGWRMALQEPSFALGCPMPSDGHLSEFSEAAFRQLMDAAPDAMVIVAGDGRIAFVNIQ